MNCCCIKTKRLTNPTATTTTRLMLRPRPISKQHQSSSVQSPPPLRQCPRYNNSVLPLQRKPTENESVKEKATASDVLQLIDSLKLPIDPDTYRALIKECTLSRDTVQGIVVHAHIKKSGRQLISLSNRLLLMYAACNRPDLALQLFNEMPVRNAGSWVTMISSVANSGSYREALGLFVDMVKWQSIADPTDSLVLIFTFVIRSCFQVADVEFGKQIHGLASKLVVCSALTNTFLHFYAGLGCHDCAQKLFDSMKPCSCDAAMLVCVHCKQGHFEEAFRAFRHIFIDTRIINDEKTRKTFSIAFASILSVCARTKGIGFGKQVHACAVKMLLDSDLYVGSSLVNMYGRFGLLTEARRAFEAVGCSSRSRDTEDSACWNAMLTSYVRNDCSAEAVKLLYEMKSIGIEPLESIVSQVRIACGVKAHSRFK